LFSGGLRAMGGSNYVFEPNGLYTTATGSPRPTNTSVTLQSGDEGLEAMWSGGGRLQQTRDLENWEDVLLGPGTVTNDFSGGARVLRVYHP
jgi:hypothetical protein